MNAGQLFTNELYAWKQNRSKGQMPLDALKVRLRHTEQRKRDYMQNRSTYAAITVVDTGREYTVPAREIVDFWDAYEGERDVLLEERRQAEMKRRRETLRKEVLEGMVNYRLQEREIPLVPKLNFWGSTAEIPTDQFVRWLEITEADIQRAIDEAMVREYGET